MSAHDLDQAVRQLRAVILAGENYRQVLAERTGLGVTELQALSYLAVHGDRGQSDLAADLGITSSASTALVDRLERQNIAERYAHPTDRRRLLVRLTDRGRAILAHSHDWLAAALDRVPPGELTVVVETLRMISEDLRAHSARIRSGEVALHLPHPGADRED